MKKFLLGMIGVAAFGAAAPALAADLPSRALPHRPP